MDETLKIGRRMLTSRIELDRRAEQLLADAYQHLLPDFDKIKLPDFALDLVVQNQLEETNS